LIAGVLLCLSLALLFLTTGSGNRSLLFMLYFDGAFLIFLMENNGRDLTVFGMPVIWLTHMLFFLLFVIAGTKLLVRRRSGQMATTPLEYLILFSVISVPLLPEWVVGHHHLLTVIGKSVILFVGYRMVLMHEAKRNRKIILATLGVLFLIVVKGLIQG
jgi:hypothetical protein